MLRWQLDIAKEELKVQKDGFELFSEQQGARVAEWKPMVEDFEADGTKRNLYEAKFKGMATAYRRSKSADAHSKG
jgi:hypothetical protein